MENAHNEQPAYDDTHLDHYMCAGWGMSMSWPGPTGVEHQPENRGDDLCVRRHGEPFESPPRKSPRLDAAAHAMSPVAHSSGAAGGRRCHPYSHSTHPHPPPSSSLEPALPPDCTRRGPASPGSQADAAHAVVLPTMASLSGSLARLSFASAVYRSGKAYAGECPCVRLRRPNQADCLRHALVP
eukprot:scaffold2927_cov408-Prasinococcus_capsulatus_cf.AAC.17